MDATFDLSEHDPIAPEVFQHDLELPPGVLPSTPGAPRHAVSLIAYDALRRSLPLYPVPPASLQWLEQARQHSRSTWAPLAKQGLIEAQFRKPNEAIVQSRYERLRASFLLPPELARPMAGGGEERAETPWNGEDAAQLQADADAVERRAKEQQKAIERNLLLASLDPTLQDRVEGAGSPVGAHALALKRGTALDDYLASFVDRDRKPAPTWETLEEVVYAWQGWPSYLPRPEHASWRWMPGDTRIPNNRVSQIRPFDGGTLAWSLKYLPDLGPVPMDFGEWGEEEDAILREFEKDLRTGHLTKRIWRLQLFAWLMIRVRRQRPDVVLEKYKAVLVETTTQTELRPWRPGDPGAPHPKVATTQVRAPLMVSDGWGGRPRPFSTDHFEQLILQAMKGGPVPVADIPQPPAEDAPDPMRLALAVITDGHEEMNPGQVFAELNDRGVAVDKENPAHHKRVNRWMSLLGFKKREIQRFGHREKLYQRVAP